VSSNPVDAVPVVIRSHRHRGPHTTSPRVVRQQKSHRAMSLPVAWLCWFCSAPRRPRAGKAADY